jgi:hypothetical protein
MAATGFLSSWITALYERFESPDIVSSVLSGGRTQRVAFFPGTDWRLLFSERRRPSSDAPDQ